MEQNTPKVSIVMPNYNNGLTIGDAIKSVINQSYKDWELIIVDDGSTDDSVSIINDYKSKHRINFYKRFIKNSGSPVRPRNAAIEIAGGKYVAFLDSDDSWTKSKLERQVLFMESRQDMVLSYHDMALNILRRGKYFWFDIVKPHRGYCFEYLLYKNFIASSSVMIRKDVLIGLGKPQDESLKISHDWDLWLRIAHHCCIDYIPSVLGRLNILGGVTSNKKLMRSESRRVVRRWKGNVSPFWWYFICLWRYYLVEIYDWLRRLI